MRGTLRASGHMLAWVRAPTTAGTIKNHSAFISSPRAPVDFRSHFSLLDDGNRLAILPTS